MILVRVGTVFGGSSMTRDAVDRLIHAIAEKHHIPMIVNWDGDPGEIFSFNDPLYLRDLSPEAQDLRRRFVRQTILETQTQKGVAA